MSRWLFLVLVLAVPACAGGDAPKPPPPPPPAAPLPDAAVLVVPSSGTFDPMSGRHLDDDVPPPAVAPRPSDRNPRAQRPIDLTLRSTPTGAMAAVDGVQIGLTPVYWSGDANGKLHEFTFVAPHYAVARYRFVPVTSGILFARLDAVTGEEPPADAGAPPVVPPPALTPPPPPPTVIAPRPPPPPPVDAALPPAPPTDASEAPPPIDAAPDPHTGPEP